MPSPRRRFSALLVAVVLAVGQAGPGRAELRTGLDLTVDGSVGLRGGARGGESLHGTALAHAGWETENPDAPGLSVATHVSALTLLGRGPTGRYLGDFLAASNTEGHAGTRLYASWVEVARGGWSVRLGAQLADEEFAATGGGAEFINSAFGWPAFISANTVNTGPAFFVPALGLRFEHAWSERGVWRIGVYDGDTFDSATGDPRVNRHGTRFHLGGDQGCFTIGEVAWAVPAGGAEIKAGAWYHSATFADVRDDANGRPHALSGAEPHLHSSNYGLYAALEIALGRQAANPDAGARLFVRAGISPSDRNMIAWSVDAGVSKRGLLPGRPADVAYLGLAQAVFSSHVADHERLLFPTAAPSDHERVVEAGYAVALSDRWNLRPDLQYIRHARGRANRADALVLLVRSQHSF